VKVVVLHNKRMLRARIDLTCWSESITFWQASELLAANPPAVMALLSLGSKYESILLQLMNDPIGIYDDDRTS